MSEFESKTKDVWARMAVEHPEFTPAHDALKNPWSVESLLLSSQINTETFPDGDVLDIGANAGILTAYWALNEARVTAYEADPITFGILNDMLIQTNLKDKVNAVNAAVWTYTGEVKFQGSPEAESKVRDGCLWVDERPAGFYEGVNKESVVPCTSFVEVLGNTVWDCVKMDIEGAEFEVLLRTPVGILRDRIKYMQLEFHHEWAIDSQYQELMTKLESIFHIDGQGSNEKWEGRFLWAHLRRK
jgi:FkbM family methyltransferase